jgi:hypothetical protein
MEEQARQPESGTRPPETAHPPQAEKKHPDRWEADLNPERLAGQNVGVPEDLPSASAFPDLRRSLTDFTADELKEISVLAPGTRLRQGATYLDLAREERSEITATGEMVAGPDERLVPKSEVPYTLWNRLRGIDDPERTT